MLSSGLVLAQCVLCYTSAAAAKGSGIHALRSGILLLGTPAVFLFVGILVLAARRRNRFYGVPEAAPAKAPLRETT